MVHMRCSNLPNNQLFFANSIKKLNLAKRANRMELPITLNEQPSFALDIVHIPDNFPRDLWTVVWFFLPIEDKAGCRLVCVEWQSLLDSIKNPLWWQHYLIDLVNIPDLNTLALQWVEDHTKAISRETMRFRADEDHDGGLVWSPINSRFMLWLLDNVKPNRYYYLVVLEQATSTEFTSFDVVKKVHEFITPTLEELRIHDVCDGTSLFRKCPYLTINPHVDMICIGEHLTKTHNITNTKYFSLAIMACASGNLDKFRYHLAQVEGILTDNNVTHLWQAALHNKSTIMLDELVRLGVQNRDLLTLEVNPNYHVSVIEWVLLRSTFKKLNEIFYLRHFVTLCQLTNTTDEEFETLKRINKLAGNPVVPISCFEDEFLEMPQLGTFGTWLFSVHEIYWDGMHGDKNIASINFMHHYCMCLDLTKRAFAIFKLKGTTIGLTNPSQKDKLLCCTYIIGKIYCKSPTEVIEYLWEEKFLDADELANPDLFVYITLNADKDRLLWLYRNREMPKPESVEMFNFNANPCWKTIKHIHEIGLFSGDCGNQIIARLFEECLYQPSVAGVEWCYQTFPFIRKKNIECYDARLKEWIENRVPPELIVNPLAASDTSNDYDINELSDDELNNDGSNNDGSNSDESHVYAFKIT